MKRNFSLSRDYPHSPKLVWRALTDPDLLATWLMENDFAPVVGHKFQFKTKPQPGFDGITNCEILEVVPEKVLAYTFEGGGIDTIVRYRLEEISTGTRLHIEHTGFEGFKAVLISFLMQRGSNQKYGTDFPALLDDLAKEPQAKPFI